MKIIKRDLDQNSGGYIKVCPTEEVDLYLLSELIRRGDRVSCHTTRKIIREKGDAGTTTVRKALTLTIAVQEIDYDGAETLHVRGTVVIEVEDIMRGSSHSLWLQINKAVAIIKEHWTNQQLKDLEESCNAVRGCDTLALLILRDGTAKIGFVNELMVVPCPSITCTIPKKTRYNESKVTTAFASFFKAICTALKTEIVKGTIKLLLICGLQEVTAKFAQYYRDELGGKEPFKLIHHVVIQTSQPTLHKAILEAMTNKEVASVIGDCRWRRASEVIEDFRINFAKNEDLAHYTVHDVLEILKTNPTALSTVLVSTVISQGRDLTIRKQIQEYMAQHSNYIEFIEVKTQTEPGKQLAKYGNAIGLTKYPVHYEHHRGEDVEDESSFSTVGSDF
ncbi:Putative eRF1 domain 1 protein [Giardia duodenalis]|uniref:Putative eRF1 domain 1 protein n=1 Tax=Giardia intestinalis TaxID=5741 RepID=V6TDS0_GIAIN|nr:Putative eRF1 domain 1 protein [Giardia intestinalis]